MQDTVSTSNTLLKNEEVAMLYGYAKVHELQSCTDIVSIFWSKDDKLGSNKIKTNVFLFSVLSLSLALKLPSSG